MAPEDTGPGVAGGRPDGVSPHLGRAGLLGYPSRFSNPEGVMAEGRVVVVGSSVLDTVYRVEALPLPGETAVAREVVTMPGGKGANQAVAACRLGAPVTFVGRVGADDAGRRLIASLEEAGVEVQVRVSEDVETGHAAVFVDEGGENQIVVHLGANARLVPDDVDPALLASASVLVTQLEIPFDTIRAAAKQVGEAGGITILNAAPFDPAAAELLPLFDITVVNRSEAEQLTGVGIASLDDALAALRALKDMGTPVPVITLGPTGAVYHDHGRGAHAKSVEVEAVDATGAGDAFVGALATFKRARLDIQDAVQRACIYAAHATAAAGAREGYLDAAAFEAEIAHLA